METRVMVFLAVVVPGLFGVMSAVLGFLAEAKKLTPADIHVYGTECVYPSSPAFWLAVGAILLLAASQIIASVFSSCCGCCRSGDNAGASKKSTRRVAGVVVSVLSWITAVIAVVFYWIGAAWNVPERRYATFTGREEECLYLKDGVFIRAAVLTLVSTTLAIKSCILLRAPAATAEPVAGAAAEFKRDGQNPPESGIAIGLPQWPAQGYGQAPYQQPVQAPYGQARV